MIAAGLGHRVTAIDLAEPMLEIARAKAQGRGLSVTFQHGDPVAPEFPEKSFDAVVSRHLFWTLRDPVTALYNWRLLRPGGRMVAIAGFWFKPETEAGDASEQSGLFEQFYSKEIRTALPGWRHFSVEPLVEIVKGAGFSAVGVKVLDAVQRVAFHPPSEKPAYAIVGFAADS
jgi:ubiquinone/menaquinone biosynthesis C-methylase UbiE